MSGLFYRASPNWHLASVGGQTGPKNYQTEGNVNDTLKQAMLTRDLCMQGCPLSHPSYIYAP